MLCAALINMGYLVKQFLQQRAAIVGILLLSALLLFTFLGPSCIPYAPNTSDFSYGIGLDGQPIGPTTRHWLGTDGLFRDELARIAAGARLSLTISIAATSISCALGSLVGMVSGYVAATPWRWLDSLLMRILDTLLCFPYLLLVMAIGAALEQTSTTTVFIVLGLTSWLGTARVMRAKTLQIRHSGYVLGAQALGQYPIRILWNHILPNVAGTLIVLATTSMAGMILAESVLSYLHVGVAPPTATWGRMLYEGQASFVTRPRLVLAPGVLILSSTLGFYLLGESLRNALDKRNA